MYTPTAEEVAAIPPFRGEEQVGKTYTDPARYWQAMADDERLQKSVVRSVDTGDGQITEYANGASIWLAMNEPLAGTGLKKLTTP